MPEQKPAERQRTFSVGRPTEEPVTFTIAYERKVDDEWVEEEQEFTLPGRVPGGVIADLFMGGGGIEAMLRFLDGLLPPEGKERFQALVHDHDVAVPAAMITEVAFWLVDVYTDRPTRPPKSSRTGRAANKTGSKASKRSAAD